MLCSGLQKCLSVAPSGTEGSKLHVKTSLHRIVQCDVYINSIDCSMAVSLRLWQLVVIIKRYVVPLIVEFTQLSWTRVGWSLVASVSFFLPKCSTFLYHSAYLSDTLLRFVCRTSDTTYFSGVVSSRL